MSAASTAGEYAVGDVLLTLLGERIEITNEIGERLVLYYPEREGADGGAYTELVAPGVLAARAAYEGYTREGESTHEPEGEGEGEGEEGAEMAGEWHSTPRCPHCARYMGRDRDGMGLPAAQCSRDGCEGWMDVGELIDRGHFCEH